MKVKILVVSPYSKDANSFWRCVGPMSYLAKHSGGDIEMTLFSEDEEVIAWDTVIQHDIVFLHRPCRPMDLTIMQIARVLNVPVWIDYDDWLFHLPPWNRAAGMYHSMSFQNVMAHCIASADVISVTTAALYDQFRKVNRNVVIVPNAYRSDLFTYRTENPKPRKPVFMWRGSDTHDGDLHSVLPAFSKLKGKVHFLGSPSWQVLNTMKPEAYQQHGAQDNLLFQRFIVDLAPKVVICPLDKIFFNHCKSNIAYIEGLHAGALIVAPNIAEWKRPGVITYEINNSDSFLEATTQAIEMNDESHAAEVKQAYEHMKSLYDISVVNEIRIGIVKAMTASDFQRNNRDPFDQLVPMWVLSQLKGTKMPEVSQQVLQSKNLQS